MSIQSNSENPRQNEDLGIKQFCQDHMISWIPSKDGVSCVKIVPRSLDGSASFFSMKITSNGKWAISVWKDEINGPSKSRKLHLYIESNCGLDPLNAMEIACHVFDSIGKDKDHE